MTYIAYQVSNYLELSNAEAGISQKESGTILKSKLEMFESNTLGEPSSPAEPLTKKKKKMMSLKNQGAG